MNARQRVVAALNHQEPDRVPMDLGSTIVSSMLAGVYNRLKKHLGINSPPLPGSGPSRKVLVETEVMERLQTDTRPIMTQAPRDSREISRMDEGYFRNEWGVEYSIPHTDSYAYVPTGIPLATAAISDIDSYDWPDPHDPGRTERLREKARILHEQNEYAIVGNVDKPSVFEIALAVRGFEQLLTDMALDKTFAFRLFEKITEIQIARYEHLLDETGEYLDIIVFGDDVGTQRGTLISAAAYQNLLKPFHKMLYDAIRRKTKAKIFYHTCGDCYELIPDFIEIGVNILNPIQVTACNMKTDKLKREFGKDLCFWGAIDTQVVLPKGSPEDVRTEVRQRVVDLATGGGYIVAPVHNVVNDVPPENIAAIYAEILQM